MIVSFQWSFFPVVFMRYAQHQKPNQWTIIAVAVFPSRRQIVLSQLPPRLIWSYCWFSLLNYFNVSPYMFQVVHPWSEVIQSVFFCHQVPMCSGQIVSQAVKFPQFSVCLPGLAGLWRAQGCFVSQSLCRTTSRNDDLFSFSWARCSLLVW